MKHFDPILRKTLLACLLLVLLLPWIQRHSGIFTVKPLNGHEKKADTAIWSASAWLEGRFQYDYEKELARTQGLREPLIRLHNQIEYTFFDRIFAEAVVLGKKGYLYDPKHLNAYSGNDFRGEVSIRSTVRQVKYINDALQPFHKTVILAIAPGKATFCPEYVPDGITRAKSGQTNAETFIREAKKQGVPLIDYYHILLRQKRLSTYPLFSKYGIHWSHYAAFQAMDTLLATIEKHYQIKLAEPHVTRVQKAQAKEADIDLLQLMNLWKNPELPLMGYPELQWKSTPATSTPSVLVIADSYYWNINGYAISNAFSNYHFWFYNNEIHPIAANGPRLTRQLDLKKEIAQHDIILVLSSDANLYQFGWGFFEQMEKMLRDPANMRYLHQDYNAKLDQIRNSIRSDRNWLKDVSAKAAQKQLPLDSMITLDAQWVYHQYHKK